MNLEDAKAAATLNGSFEVYRLDQDWFKVAFNPSTGKLKRGCISARDLDAKDWEAVVPDSFTTRKAKMLQRIVGADRVWTNSGHGDRSSRDTMATVKRVTATQILLEPGSEFDRYDRFTGYRKGGGMWQPSIIAIATKAEAIAYDAKKATEQDVRTADKNAEDAFVELRSTLRDKFPEIPGTTLWIRGNRRKGTFTVEINDLTQAQVEKLAETMLDHPIDV